MLTVPLFGGQVQLTISFPVAGPHTAQAVYAGDASFLGSSSNVVDQQVIQVAVEDTFAATGNIAIQVVAPGVLTNDLAGAVVTQVQGGAPGARWRRPEVGPSR